MIDVVIAGGGPNGLMLACELALAGVRPVVLERLAEPTDEPKANGLLGQVVRMVDRRGLYERLSGGDGPPRPNSAYFMFAAMPMNLGLLDGSPIYGLAATQPHIVRVLTERAIELGVEIRRGHEVVGLTQDDDAVTVHVAGPDGPYEERAGYLAGVEGAHSVTRKLSGIDFPGVTYDRATARMAHATVPAEWIDPTSGALTVPGHGAVLPFLPQRTDRGGFSYSPLPGLPPIVATSEWDQPATDAPMTFDELRASVRRVLGVDVPLEPPAGAGPHLLRRLVGGNTRVASRYRDRRAFLVGDAAHVFSGGGSGLNLGLQDAINLAWKLAADLRGDAPAGLLDSYETERRAAALRVVTSAQAQSALLAPGGDVTALRELFAELLDHRETVQLLADLTAGSDVRYDMGVPDAHPLVGTFAPELVLRTANGTVRLAELTRTARPLLLDLTEDGSLAGAVAGVDVVVGRVEGFAPTALLLRPDSYVAWAAEAARPDLAELRAAARRWFGALEPAVG